MQDKAIQVLLWLEPLQVLSDDATFTGAQVAGPAAAAETVIREQSARIAELEAKLAGAEIKNSRLRSERESLQVRFALVQNAILPVASWYAVERGRNVEDVVSDIVHDLIRDRAEALKRQEDRRKIGNLEAQVAEANKLVESCWSIGELRFGQSGICRSVRAKVEAHFAKLEAAREEQA